MTEEQTLYLASRRRSHRENDSRQIDALQELSKRGLVARGYAYWYITAAGQQYARERNWKMHDNEIEQLRTAQPSTTQPRTMCFSAALMLVKSGRRVARQGWNGKDMFIFLVPGSEFKVSRPPLLGIYPEGAEIQYHPHVDMKTAQGYVVPWVVSQADLLAEDWVLVGEAL